MQTDWRLDEARRTTRFASLTSNWRTKMTASKTFEQKKVPVPSQIPLWREPAVWLGLMGAIGGVLIIYLSGNLDPLIMR
jgi:hypothetical protein